MDAHANQEFLASIPHRVLRDFAGPIDLPAGRFHQNGVVLVQHPDGVDVLTRKGELVKAIGPTTAVPIDLSTYPHEQLRRSLLEALGAAITRRKQRTHELERLSRRLNSL